MFCHKCGKPTASEGAFCTYCGSRVSLPTDVHEPALMGTAERSLAREFGNASILALRDWKSFLVLLIAFICLASIGAGLVYWVTTWDFHGVSGDRKLLKIICAVIVVLTGGGMCFYSTFFLLATLLAFLLPRLLLWLVVIGLTICTGWFFFAPVGPETVRTGMHRENGGLVIAETRHRGDPNLVRGLQAGCLDGLFIVALCLKCRANKKLKTPAPQKM